MAWQSGFERREPGWRELAWAAGGALAVTLFLIISVAVIWRLGGGPISTTALTAPQQPQPPTPPQTPTPRALSFAARTPAPDEPANAAREEPLGSDTTGAVIETTPSLMNLSIEGEPASDGGPVLDVSSEEEMAALARGSWSAAPVGLVNNGSDAVSEEWLLLASAPGPDLAIDVEIRVTGTLPTVCDQSFGIAGGSPEAGQVFGAGVIFPCAGDSPLARLTDVTSWQNGYNQAPVIAESAFDPGNDWHTYRFELRDGQLQLLIDGERIVEGPAEPGIAAASETETEAGLWSQGVGVEVRRVTVSPLPAS